MNLMEQMLMAAIGEAISKLPTDARVEQELAVRKVLADINELEPGKIQAVLCLAVHEVVRPEDNEPGLGLAVCMTGGENVLMLLADGAQKFLTVQHMKMHHPEEIENDPILKAVLSGGNMEAGKIVEQFAPASAKH